MRQPPCSTAGCGKPHVRWCGSPGGLNPVRATRSDRPRLLGDTKAWGSDASGFTLIELLVVIAISAILATLLFPVAGRMFAASQATRCSTNMKTLATGMLAYVGDNNGQFPKFTDGQIHWWMDEIQPYVTGKSNTGPARWYRDAFYCPSSKKPHPYASYGPHPYLIPEYWSSVDFNPSMKLVSIPKPAATVLLSECYNPTSSPWDSSWYFPVGSDRTYLPQPHGGSLNLAYCDGHIASMKHQDAADNYTSLLGSLPVP